MPIFWRGCGILVPFLTGIVFLVTIYGVDFIARDDQYCSRHYWPKLLGGILSALAIWFVGRRVNRDVPVEIRQDKHGRELRRRITHTLYLMDFEYWSIVVLGFTIVFYWV